MSAIEANDSGVTPRAWAQALALAPYRGASAARGVFELAVTAIPFVVLWAAMLLASGAGHIGLSLLITPVEAGFLVRLFMIQHDCGHGAFFPDKCANDWVGRAIGIVTMTPYDHWRRCHAIHHATSGNLDRRGIGDIKTLTAAEYFAKPRRGRLRYRLYRHPLVMFGVGPLYLFLIENRLPLGFMGKGPMPWVSTMTTNGGIFAAGGLLIWCAVLAPVLVVVLPIIAIAATTGVWLFYVQHQFEETTWERAADWTQPEAALHGSSYYQLPPPLSWFSANVGVHHVHHLSSGIPFYRLREALKNHPDLGRIGRLSLRGSLACVRLTLWYEERRQMVSFGEAEASRSSALRAT